jgi:PAS domain S-box-containing protein
MEYLEKSKEQLIKEIEKLRAEMEALEIVHKKDLEELEESREKYRGLSEAAFESIFLSEKGVCIEQNIMGEQTFGYSNEEALGRYGTDWIVPEDRPMVMNMMLTGYEFPYEATAIKKDGTTFPCVLKGKMMNYKNKLVRVTSLTDITIQKKAQHDQKASEEIFKIISENTSDGILQFDSSSNLIYASPGAHKMMEMQPEDSINMTLSDLIQLIHPVDRAKIVIQISISRKNKVDYSLLTYRIQKKSGNYIWLEVNVKYHYDKDRNLLNSILIARDISERKKFEIELIKAKETAEAGNKLKTAFINNISHEIRTPINGILGFLSFILDENLEEDERRDFIRLINENANRLINTIDDIVGISQIHAGQVKPNLDEISLNSLAYEINSIYQYQAKKKNIDFKYINNISDEDSTIISDNDKLYSILTNLLDNAIKFTFSGSIDFTINNDNDFILLSVKDTGIGVPESKLFSIFDPFMQADVSSSRQFEGSGLGLSIAKAYAEMLGGKIWVESEVGKGSTFYIRIKK